MLLIFSNKNDIATDFLVCQLHERNVHFVRVNTEDYLKKWEVDFYISSQEISPTIIFNNGLKIHLKSVTGAYIRQPHLPKIQIAESDIEFSKREIGEVFRSIWRYIDDGVWLNSPRNILRASNKPEQLRTAVGMGLQVPKTCITTNPDVIRLFYADNNEKIIAKAVKHGFLFDGVMAKVAATQFVDKAYVADIESYAKIPLMLQEQIEKEFDVRVTVVGENVFPTAIFSQEFAETSIDWRLADHFKIILKHEKVVIPLEIENKCRQLTRYFKLRYSAIDMIKSKNGEYYFLELNPNGQWAWIEQIAGHKIRDALIDCLICKTEQIYERN